MKKLLSLLIAIVASLAGCATVIGEKIDRTVEFAGGGEREFLFNKKVANQEIRKNKILDVFVNSLVATDIYRPLSRNYGSLGVIHSYGMRTEISENGIKISHIDNHGHLLDSRTALFKIDILETPRYYMVKLYCPNSYQDKATSRGGVIDVKPYFTGAQVEENLNEMCRALNPKINLLEFVRGEINSKYSSEDVFANFSRILKAKVSFSKEEVKSFDIEKAQVFHLTVDGLDTTIALSVFPYRGGSKTVYAFKYPIKVNPDGTNTYSGTLLKTIENRIIEIAND